MTTIERLLLQLDGRPTPATEIAKAMNVGYDTIASLLSALHKTRVVRAESIWVPHSKRPILHYFVSERTAP